MTNWLDSLLGTNKARRQPGRHRHSPRPARRGARLSLEQLESRTVLSAYMAASAADLIADINAANTAGGANTITLAPAASPYLLTAVNNTTNGATGLPVITAGDNLTIVGNGDTIERSAASGTPAFRLLDVATGASLTLDNLTLEGGLAQLQRAGGLACRLRWRYTIAYMAGFFCRDVLFGRSTSWTRLQHAGGRHDLPGRNLCELAT